MKKFFSFIFLLFVSLAFSSNLDKPNIIIMMTDDMGWNDVGYHNAEVKTPHLDAFVMEGIELDRFYVSTQCTPTRAGLLTGRYPDRVGVRKTVIPPWCDFGINPDEDFLPEMLSRQGYKHRSVLGKWHLGHSRPEFLPNAQGFSYFYGHYNGAIDCFSHERNNAMDWHENDEPCFDEGYSTDLLAAKAVKLIDSAAIEDEPFFLYLAFNAPHGPLQAPREYLDMYGYDPTKPTFADKSGYGEEGMGNTERQTYMAMITCVDDAIGDVLDALDRNSIKENTFVLFCSDNGPAVAEGGGQANPLRGAKFQEWEGGVRVPAAVRYPAQFSGGQKNSTVLSFVDVMPTIREMVNDKFPIIRPFDGRSFYEVLRDNSNQLDDREMFLGKGALIKEGWKIILADGNPSKMKLDMGDDQLFKIDEDPNETTNVKDQYPEDFQRMKDVISPYLNIISPFEVPDYGDGQAGFVAPENWHVEETPSVCLYVSTNGDDTNGDGSLDNPYKTIIKACVEATDNDSVFIAAGVYTTDNEIDIHEKSIVLVGEDPLTTIIQAHAQKGMADHRVLKTYSGTISVKNLTIRHGVFDKGDGTGDGGGILNMGELVLENVIVCDNSAVQGGGVFSKGNSIKLKNCVVENNSSQSFAGGLYLQAKNQAFNAYLENCLVANNSSSGGKSGGGIVAESLSDNENKATLNIAMVNTTVAFNQAENTGGGMLLRNNKSDANHVTNASFINCTFTQNKVPANKDGAAIYVKNISVYTMHNSIVLNNYADDVIGGIAKFGTNSTSKITGNSNLIDQLIRINFDEKSKDNNINALGNEIIEVTLQDKGGISKVVPIIKDGLAQNAADPLQALGIDQRWYKRDSLPDVGAYEFDASKIEYPVHTGVVNHLEAKTTIFPNPCTDVLNVITPSSSVKVYDMMGQVIFLKKNKKRSAQIDVTDFRSGVYLLVSDDNMIEPVRFVKK